MLHDEPIDDNQFNKLRAHEVDSWEAPDDLLQRWTDLIRFGACLLILVGFGIAWWFEPK
jgi:hypothetical protein